MIKPLVADTSFVAKLLFSEPGSDVASAVLAKQKARLIAPRFLQVECAAVAWKRCQRGELAREAAIDSLTKLSQLPIDFVEDELMLAGALDLAIVTGRTVYDSLYLATAIANKGTVITADERFVNALHGGPFERYAQLLGGR